MVHQESPPVGQEGLRPAEPAAGAGREQQSRRHHGPERNPIWFSVPGFSVQAGRFRASIGRASGGEPVGRYR
ncbi:hypothetical protein GCM10009848_46250 [Micromonospora lupini]